MEPLEKRCKACQRVLSIEAFEKNQYLKGNIVARRSECKECRKKAKRYPHIPERLKKDFESSNPRPKIGDEFTCPICKRTMIVQKNRDVNLDHNHSTGAIRGYVCNDCNTGMGNFKDSIDRLKRAIKWIKGTLK